MARRLIGLDVGTNAVTIAEVTPGSPPRLDMFAQVALPREAMTEGEISDEAAVSDAVARLRAEVGLKKASVRVGIASPRVIVRQVEMPVMTREELASALKFQASDLIPISLDDAVLDFAILETHTAAPGSDGDGGGESRMQVLLAAAQEATIMKIVSSVEGGGLQVAAVDLIPLALIRALARRPVPAMAPAAAGGGVMVDDGTGAEGIVSFGGGVTSIAVHEAGVPRFVRIIASGGRELTDAIAHDLEVPPDTAEALKRAVGAPGEDQMVARARTAIDRPLSVLLDEVRSSIDYYRNQPGAGRLQRVVVTGGSAQLPGLPERLSALVGVQVEPAYMHDLIRVGDIGFAPDELPRLEPYLPAAVGLALGGAGVGTVVDLLPRTRRNATKTRGQVPPKIIAGAAAAVLVLGGLTYMAYSNASSAKSKAKAAQVQEQKLSNEVGRLQLAQSGGPSAGSSQALVEQLLGGDVSWPKVLGDVGNALPGGVLITSFQGAHTLTTTNAAASTTPTTTAGSAASGTPASTPAPTSNGRCTSVEQPLTGTVSMSGIAPNVPAVASFIDALSKAGGDDPEYATSWASSIGAGTFGGAKVVTFTIAAQIGNGVRSDRLQTYFLEALCK
jgi:type IV pilus assembly protein PilM